MEAQVTDTTRLKEYLSKAHKLGTLRVSDAYLTTLIDTDGVVDLNKVLQVATFEMGLRLAKVCHRSHTVYVTEYIISR